MATNQEKDKPSLHPEPDLFPIYPSPLLLASLLPSLSPAQRSTLVSHSLARAALFADLPLLHYLLHDALAVHLIDLNAQDDDGLSLISLIILGFGPDSDRDVDREECIRLLVAQGADVNIPDKAGWSPLHHAALSAPPTVIAYLLTHGASALSRSHRNLTPHDIVTAYSVIPGREDIALFLQEAMLSEGWDGLGGRLVRRRISNDRKLRQNDHRRIVRNDIRRCFDLGTHWWADDDDDDASSDDEHDESDDSTLFTPPVDYTSMLVFSPSALPQIFSALIAHYPPASRNSVPAGALYRLARFACLICDHNWLEELIIGATDAIEDTIFAHPDDLSYLIFWLYNLTVWLHLMRCDAALNETCDMLGSFLLIEEVINSVFVFLIRFAERQIDKILDSALLEYAPPSAPSTVQFESEWSLFRSPFKKKASNIFTYHKDKDKDNRESGSASPPRSPSPQLQGFNLNLAVPSSSTTTSSSPSPNPSGATTPSKPFSSLRHSFIGSSSPVSTPSVRDVFNFGSGGEAGAAKDKSSNSAPSPRDVEGFLGRMNMLLVDSGINPAFVAQVWSQVLYWVACELFNRILTRKRYLCRSKAAHISSNVSVLEDWIVSAGLPRGIKTHFAPVRELLVWLQCLSTMTDFSDLVGTIQSLRHLNPLQMRRAVRDYRYEVNEGRMSEDCSQYLQQLQKDWERQRVKMGVEALRKEIDREKAVDGSVSSGTNDLQPNSNNGNNNGNDTTARQDTPTSSATTSTRLASPPSSAFLASSSLPATNGTGSSTSKIASASTPTPPISSHTPSSSSISSITPSLSLSISSAHQKSIDALFDSTSHDLGSAAWVPAQPPEVLGELLDSRYMLPLLFPSDARMLGVLPISGVGVAPGVPNGNGSAKGVVNGVNKVNGNGKGGAGGTIAWHLESKKLRRIGTGLLKCMDGLNLTYTTPPSGSGGISPLVTTRGVGQLTS